MSDVVALYSIPDLFDGKRRRVVITRRQLVEMNPAAFDMVAHRLEHAARTALADGRITAIRRLDTLEGDWVIEWDLP